MKVKWATCSLQKSQCYCCPIMKANYKECEGTVYRDERENVVPQDFMLVTWPCDVGTHTDPKYDWTRVHIRSLRGIKPYQLLDETERRGERQRDRQPIG